MATKPTGTPGATIYSVADRAGVSIATVSRVLQGSSLVSEKARTKVQQAARELNYVPLAAARNLAVRQHEAHGLVLPELTGPYYSELLMGFESRAAALGQSVVLMLAADKPDLARAVAQLATRVDGIALLASAAIPDEVVRSVQGRKPVLVISGDAAQPGVDTVSAENLHSAHDLATHLLEHGRRRLLFVGDPDLGPDIRTRYDGFVAAHTDRGLTAAEPVRIPFREADGTAYARGLLAGELPADALVCANDELALAIMQTLQDGGRRVPDDVAVVGWDDVMTARYVRPGLTTVRQPVARLGALAADRLHDRVTGATVGEHAQTVPTELVLRSSCGCPPPAPPPAPAPAPAP